ncbi:MAG: DsbA family protein [Candidatus Daviesbacteria bacterium]
MDSKTSWLTGPMAILIGSVIVSIAILIAGGTITLPLGNIKGAQITPTTTPQVTTAPQKPTITLNQIKETFSKAAIKFGDANKKLIVLEVSDPSCPYCQVAAGKNPELNKEAGSKFTLVADGGTYVAPVPEIEKLVKDGKASFAFLYFPGHGNGELGTKALYCAFEQGKFWETHDLLMSSKGYDLLNNQVKNDKTKIGELADFLQPAIDSATLTKCLESGKYDDQLKTDMSLAGSLGISGTPGFYLNTTNFSGAYSYKDMESVVASALK